MTSKASNIVWHKASVDREARSLRKGHKSAILWFTGLSGSGKSTLANAVNAAASTTVITTNGFQ